MNRMLTVAAALLVLVPVAWAQQAKDDADVKTVWRPVAIVVDGKEQPIDRETTLLSTAGAEYTVTVKGQIIERGTATIDESANPLQADLNVTEGPEAGKTILQIFKAEGDVLIACQDRAGGARPTEFTSKPGSGHILSVWLRVE